MKTQHHKTKPLHDKTIRKKVNEMVIQMARRVTAGDSLGNGLIYATGVETMVEEVLDLIAKERRLAREKPKHFFRDEGLEIARLARANTIGHHPDYYNLAGMPLSELASFGKRFWGLTNERLESLDKEVEK